MLISADVSILLREKVSEHCTITKNSSLKALGACFRKVKNKKKFLHTFQMVVKYAMLYTRTFSVCLFIIRIVSCITQGINISAKFS